MSRTSERWVFCRECVFFRPYAFVAREAGAGHCGANARRQRLDPRRKRHCEDYRPVRSNGRGG